MGQDLEKPVPQSHPSRCSGRVLHTCARLTRQGHSSSPCFPLRAPCPEDWEVLLVYWAGHISICTKASCVLASDLGIRRPGEGAAVSTELLGTEREACAEPRRVPPPLQPWRPAHPQPSAHSTLLSSWAEGWGAVWAGSRLGDCAPDHGPGPRCESLVDIYFQLQQEVGAAGGELDPKTRAALLSRLDEVLRTLVTRSEPPCWWRGSGRVRVGGAAPGGPAVHFPCVLLTPPSSFLVEKQPPQVLKTQTKFQAGVRFLLGLRFLGAPAKPPLVRADMVTEKQARELSMPQGPGAGA